MKRVALAFHLAMAALLLGCALPKRESVDLSFDLPKGSDRVIADRWWEAFGDEELVRVMETALEHNQDLEMALANVEAVAASARIAGSGLQPQVTAGAGSARNKQVFVGLPIPGPSGVLSSRATTHQLNVNLSWEVDVWGRIRAGKRAAESDVHASQLDYEGARLSIAGQVLRTWLSAAAAQEQLRLTKANIEVLKVSEIQAQERYAKGLQSSLDVRLARSNLANARAEEEIWLMQRRQALRQLSLLMGGYPSREDELASSLPELHQGIPEGLGSTLLRRRPDLLAAEARVFAAEHRVAEAQAARYPRFSLTSSAGTTSDKLRDLVDRNFSVWSLAGNVAQPLLDGGRLKAGKALAEASTKRAVAAYEKNILMAFEEVEAALDGEDLLQKREVKLLQAKAEAEGALQLAQERYAGGLEFYVTVLEAQRREIDAKRQLMAIRQQRLDNRVSLYLALGGGFGVFDEALETEQSLETEVLK